LRIKTINAATLALCFSHAFLLGCGGGGDSDGGGSAPPATISDVSGAYGGTLIGSTSGDFQALVLPTGEFWSLYGNDTGSIFYIDGFVQGSGNLSSGRFTTSDARDFGFAPAMRATMTATFDTIARTIDGKSTYDGAIVRFSGGPIPGSLYNYNTPALLSVTAGHWDTMSTEGRSVSINISGSGTLTLNDGGCLGSGTLRPDASGKNVFSLTVTFGGSPCAMPNQTATGIALAYPLPTGQTQVIAAVTNSSRTVGIAVFGIR
jgi:hypothetical protein